MNRNVDCNTLSIKVVPLSQQFCDLSLLAVVVLLRPPFRYPFLPGRRRSVGWRSRVQETAIPYGRGRRWWDYNDGQLLHGNRIGHSKSDGENKREVPETSRIRYDNDMLSRMKIRINHACIISSASGEHLS